MESVESAGRNPPPRTGPATGALIREALARVNELARTLRELEGLIDLPEEAPVPEQGTRPDPRAAEDATAFLRLAKDANLTRRETEVLRYLLNGHSNRRISRSLRISEATVKNHLHIIFAKLDVSDRTQAIAKVYRHLADRAAPPARAGGAHRGN